MRGLKNKPENQSWHESDHQSDHQSRHDEELLKALLKNDLGCFIHKVFNTVNPGAEYINSWHVDLIAEYLNEVEKGNIKRLIINMPPRALKSLSISIAWTAWLLGQNPDLRIMVASYSQILSNKLSLDTRFVISSPWYQNLFPATRIHKKQNQKSKFMTTKYGFRFATSVGGTATGEGGDILIVDDPHNPSQINSEKIRNKTVSWFTETFSTRLNNRADGKILLVQQRLHEDDLSGYLLKEHEDEWKLLRIPVQAKEHMIFDIGAFQKNLNKGDLLNKDLFSEVSIDNLRKEIGESNFQAQYMQDPPIGSCGILKSEYLRYYTKLPDKFEHIILSLDSAVKTSETSDFSALTCWGIFDGCYYLISVMEEKLEYPDLKREAKKSAEKYNPSKFLIEDKSSGHSLIQDLQREGIKNIVPISLKADKITIFATTLDLFESGKVLLPNLGRTRDIAEKQLLDFPNCKHDDVVDSISQFLNYIKREKRISSPNVRFV